MKFTKDGFKDTEFPIEANINNWFWGNIIFGGLYGSTTDAVSGAAYEYKPGSYMVTLQPDTGAQAPNSILLNEKQKIINFIVMGYNQLITELNGKSGQYTASLFELSGAPTESRDDLRKKLKSLSDVYTVIPDFAEKSADILLKK